MKVSKRYKEVIELSTYFNLSFLQVKLDNEGILSDEYVLKLITLDKILKLYFDSYICCSYNKQPEALLTKDEIVYLKPNNHANLTFIKKSITNKKKVITHKNNKDLNFYFYADNNQKEQEKIIKGLLSEVL